MGPEAREIQSGPVVLAARVATIVTGVTVSVLTTDATDGLLLWSPSMAVLAVTAAVAWIAPLRRHRRLFLPVPDWALDLAAIFLGTRVLFDLEPSQEPIIGLVVFPIIAGALGRWWAVGATVLITACSYVLAPSTPDGDHVSVLVLAMLAAAGAVLSTIAQRQAEVARRADQQRTRLEAVLSAVVRSDPRGIVVRDAQGRAVEVNEAAWSLLAPHPTAVEAFLSGREPLPGAVEPATDDDGEPAVDLVARATGDVVPEQVVQLTRDGKTTWIALTAIPVDTIDGRWVVTHLRDVTEETSTLTRLERQAARDPLTGLGNRRLLEWTLDSVDDDERIGAVVLDLDGFKPVNDVHGHDVGDEILRHVARRLDQISRADDVVIRLGGDEFLLLLRQVSDDDDVDAMVDRLRSSMRDPYPTSAGVFDVRASIGTAAGPARSGRKVLREADDSMYADKRLHRESLGAHEPT